MGSNGEEPLNRQTKQQFGVSFVHFLFIPACAYTRNTFMCQSIVERDAFWHQIKLPRPRVVCRNGAPGTLHVKLDEPLIELSSQSW
jgi:hypothetical protein